MQNYFSYLSKILHEADLQTEEVDKEDINRAVLDATYILSSIKYNGNVIKLVENEEIITSKEEQYDKFKNNGEYNFSKEE